MRSYLIILLILLSQFSYSDGNIPPDVITDDVEPAQREEQSALEIENHSITMPYDFNIQDDE